MTWYLYGPLKIQNIRRVYFWREVKVSARAGHRSKVSPNSEAWRFTYARTTGKLWLQCTCDTSELVGSGTASRVAAAGSQLGIGSKNNLGLTPLESRVGRGMMVSAWGSMVCVCPVPGLLDSQVNNKLQHQNWSLLLLHFRGRYLFAVLFLRHSQLNFTAVLVPTRGSWQKLEMI